MINNCNRNPHNNIYYACIILALSTAKISLNFIIFLTDTMKQKSYFENLKTLHCTFLAQLFSINIHIK